MYISMYMIAAILTNLLNGLLLWLFPSLSFWVLMFIYALILGVCWWYVSSIKFIVKNKVSLFFQDNARYKALNIVMLMIMLGLFLFIGTCFLLTNNVL